MTRRRWLNLAVIAVALPFVFALAFLLSAWIGSSIPRNAEWVQPPEGVEIFVGDNGIHTEIVMPLVTPQKDWRSEFPATDLADPARPYTHVAVSWGEREVFLNTPTWADLSLTTAINAATGGDGLIHAAHYVHPIALPNNRPLRITEPQYAKLVATIEAQLVPPTQRLRFSGYGRNDVFYDARGTYHLGNTCNQWTSDTLASAGVTTGWWTPLPGGVMKWVPEPAS